MKKTKTRTVVETRTVRGVLYQRELVRCGNVRCRRCKRRPTHGPYWYAYRWSQTAQRLVSKYIGKELDRRAVELERPAATWPMISSLM